MTNCFSNYACLMMMFDAARSKPIETASPKLCQNLVSREVRHLRMASLRGFLEYSVVPNLFNFRYGYPDIIHFQLKNKKEFDTRFRKHNVDAKNGHNLAKDRVNSLDCRLHSYPLLRPFPFVSPLIHCSQK